MAGRETLKKVIRLSYRLTLDLAGNPLAGSVEATIIILSAPDLPRWPNRVIRTGFEEIDGQLARVEAALTRLIVRQTVSVSHTIDGGPTIRGVISTEVDDIQIRDVPADMFEVPKSFRNQRPQFGGPGMN